MPMADVYPCQEVDESHLILQIQPNINNNKNNYYKYYYSHCFKTRNQKFLSAIRPGAGATGGDREFPNN